MNYAQFREYDIANGPGIRATLFVSGCTHNCPGCFNGEYKEFTAGTPWNEEIQYKILDHILNNDMVKGLSILGGEPLQQTNDDDLYDFLKLVKEKTHKSIWIYSGYTYEQIITDPLKLRLLELCDVLVDGRFVESLKDVRLKFKGSKNQRIIDIQKSLNSKQICEIEL